MIDEKALRRPAFVDGSWIRLADAQNWSFPEHLPYRDDEEHIGVLRAIVESEDEPERRRAELALAILLLSRNYELTPEDYRACLSFEAGDPGLLQMQSSIRELAITQCRALPRLARINLIPPRPSTTHWRLADLFKGRKHAGPSGTFRAH